MSSGWPPSAPMGCAGEGCTSGLDIWPLYDVRDGDVFCRLCSSCVLLSHRNLYCCRCFLLLGPPPPTPYDDGDPLIAPYGPITTCAGCREAVAHLSCLHSAYAVFVCPACVAASTGSALTYAPPSGTPIDVRAARVMLLATRMALAMLRRQAADARATASRNENAPPPQQPAENLAPGEGSTVAMRLELDLNAPPPPSPQPPSAHMVGMGGVMEMAMAAAEADAGRASTARPRTLRLFWNDKNPDDDGGEEM